MAEIIVTGDSSESSNENTAAVEESHDDVVEALEDLADAVEEATEEASEDVASEDDVEEVADAVETLTEATVSTDIMLSQQIGELSVLVGALAARVDALEIATLEVTADVEGYEVEATDAVAESLVENVDDDEPPAETEDRIEPSSAKVHWLYRYPRRSA